MSSAVGAAVGRGSAARYRGRMSAEYLPCVEVQPRGGAATHCMILLHGLGADGHDLASLADEIALPASVRMRFVLPHAPRRAVTLNGGMLMPAWYDIRELSLLNRGHDERGIKQSAAAITALIEREVQRGIPAERIVLAGFSQGGAMALYCGLRQQQRIAAIVAMSCYLILPDTLAAERAAANDATPIFMGHGSYDPMVPIQAGEAARDTLTKLGWAPMWRTYPMEHSIATEELADIGTFLALTLSSAAGAPDNDAALRKESH